MKRLAFVLLCIMCSFFAKAQSETFYVNIPVAETYSTSSIANFISVNYTTDRQKLLAIYSWITSNIQYNKDSMFYRYWGEDPERKLVSVLKTRKGVCENFASLLAVIATKCGIPAYSVNGYTKMNGFVNWQGHSWCAVYIDKQWLLCDPTWDYGRSNATNYFLIAPEDFINTHMPFDPLWQLLEYPVSNRGFVRSFGSTKKSSIPFNYKDSLNNYLQLDSLQQMEAFSRRMKKAGIENDDLRTWYAYNEMKIFIVRQEQDMNSFNAAVKDLNKSKTLFNDFVQYRNNHFQPTKTDSEINTQFMFVDSLLASAYKKMDDVGRHVENYQYDTDGLKQNLDTLSERIKDQKVFLKKYFAAGVAEREKLLYK